MHALTPLDDQLSSEFCPSDMFAGTTLIDTVGVGGGGDGTMGNELAVPKEQLKKEEACAHISTTAAHQASTLEREWRFLDTCMARAALVAYPPERDLVGSAPSCVRVVAYSIGPCFRFTPTVARWQARERASLVGSHPSRPGSGAVTVTPQSLTLRSARTDMRFAAPAAFIGELGREQREGLDVARDVQRTRIQRFEANIANPPRRKLLRLLIGSAVVSWCARSQRIGGSMGRNQVTLAALTAVLWAYGALAQEAAVTAFVDVQLVPMDRERVLAHQTVLVRGNTLTAVGAVDRLKVPPQAARVAGHGIAYLLPGLADMHTHVMRTEDLLPYTANGVTTILHMGGAPAELVDHIQDSIDTGETVGPQIFFAFMIDGSPALSRFYVRTPEQARAAVQLAKANGYMFIKVYNNVTAEEFAAIVEEGRRQGLPVIGHGVRSVGLPAALFQGQVMVAHAEEFYYTAFGKHIPNDPVIVSQVVEETFRSGAYVTPNLSTFSTIVRQWGRPQVIREFMQDARIRFMSPDERVDWSDSDYVHNEGDIAPILGFLESFTKALAERGVPLLTGTDSPVIPGMLPGYSIHEDLQRLSAAGLTPFQALSAATRVPEFIAKFVPRTVQFGQIKPGMRADLVLVSANPLLSLESLRQPLGVMSAGRWRTRQQLDALLAQQRSRYEQALQ